MWNQVKQSILFAVTRLNVFYPQLLGIGFWRYKKYIKQNFHQFNAERQLLDITNNAIEQVPYYNKTCKPVTSLDEFQKHIPFIDKDKVMKHWDNFQLPNYSRSRVISGTTGGTSGKPLKLIIPKNRYIFELGTLYTMWSNVEWKGQIRGVLRNTKLKEGVPFKVNPLKKEVIFDGFKTSDEYYKCIYGIMKRYNIQFLHAYPSSAYQFCVYLKKINLDTSFIKAFLLGSEGLLEEQRMIFQELKINYYHWYGHSEKLILGGYCKDSQLIHIEPTYGYFELINENGENISKIGEVGEIVGTTLHNPYMPLIRYRTGDYAEYAGNYCSSCKRFLPTIKNIQGRRDKSKIFYKDMTYTSITALNMHGDLYTHINGMQYVQKEPGKLLIKLIKDSSYNDEIEKKFTRFFKSALQENCEFTISYVNRLEFEKNGKFLPLKQYVKASNE